MKILVVGGGGREHAIIKSLKKNPAVTEIIAAPGNGGIAKDATCVNIGAKDIPAIVEFAVNNGIDYAVDDYPYYSSDAAVAWKAGCDAPAGLIGPGVHASHGMERTHIDGLMNTLKLVMCYLGC